MEASYVAANQVYDETTAKNARFKKIYEQWKQFRAEEVLWFRVVENHARQLHGAGSRRPISSRLQGPENAAKTPASAGFFFVLSLATQHPFQVDCPMS